MKKSATPTVQASGLFHRMFGVWSRRGNSLPVRKLALAVLLLAAVAFGGVFAVAQAQAADGAITGLTLTSDTPGTLTVSWETASPTPTDYRVDWAESDEDYQSWKVDEGHVYPAETATTATIADLEHDTEYKIRMRARYYRGEHAGKSWGGPWATATITVAGEPAETPTPEPVKEEPVQQPPRDDPAPDDPAPEDTTPPAGTIDTITATDAAGQLLLAWTAPAAPDADPTDYHLNWAKSAEDYPADTAEAGNAHPTGTTHTLAGLEYDTDYNIRVQSTLHATARTPPAPGTGRGPRRPPRSSCRSPQHRSSGQSQCHPIGKCSSHGSTPKKTTRSPGTKSCAAPTPTA